MRLGLIWLRLLILTVGVSGVCAMGQAFQLMDGTQSMMTLVPVEFYVMTDSAFLSVCGFTRCLRRGRGGLW
jgi:hypothetical protein